MERYIITIDQGTTSTRAILFDLRGNLIDFAQKEIEQDYPELNYVLQDPQEIIDSVYEVLTQVLIKTRVGIQSIIGIGITNQRETTIVWNRHDGKPLYPAIVWQSNQTQEICDELEKQNLNEKIRQKTGLIINPYFSATKIKWILDRYDKDRELANQGDLLFGTIDTWVLWHLTGREVHATDYSNASRTMLFNIHSLDYDEELLQLLNIPRCMMPVVKDSAGLFGYTKMDAYGLTGHIPIVSMIGDQQSSLFGQLCFKEGMAKNTYGTGCFTLMNIGSKPAISNHGLLTTLGWKFKDEIVYAVEGSVFIGGSAIRWLRDGLEIIQSPKEAEALAMQVKDSGGVMVVPSFVGLGTPYWDDNVKGAIFGLTQGSTKAHLTRATLEAIAYQVSDVLKAIEMDCGLPIKLLSVDGKASENNLMMQFQSDILNVIINRPNMVESTALGATYLAYLGLGLYPNKESLLEFAQASTIFTPMMAEQVANKLYRKWQKAIAATRLFKED